MTPPLAANVKPISDSDRLDALEAFVNDNVAIVIHTGNWSDKYHTGMIGLGLRPGCLVRTLREALDQLVRS